MSKPVVLEIDNVRVVKFNELNYAVERFEDVLIPKTKQTEKRWVFHGYTNTILSALKLISRNELLIDETDISGMKGYLKQVLESNNKIQNLKEND